MTRYPQLSLYKNACYIYFWLRSFEFVRKLKYNFECKFLSFSKGYKL